jgi:transposase
MTSNIDPISPKTWVAIDIAKGINVALIEHADGRQQRFRFVHQRDDYDRLVEFLRGCDSPCRIALEPTGDYHRTIAYRMLSEGFDLVLVSSVAGARLREAIFNSWDKNDPKDAQVIMRLLKQGITQQYCDPLFSGSHDLQELSKTYLQVSRARTRLQHVLLTHYLTLYFPEIERFWTAQRNEWFIQLLIQFPTAGSIAAISLEQFRATIWKPMGRRVHKEAKIAEIHALATRSIALPIRSESLAASTFQLQLQRYLQLCQERAALEAQADAFLAQRPDYQLLRTVPGIGPVTALQILAEAGDLRRFAHHRQFLKFCGLDLAKSQSGAFRSRDQLSKRGNANLRCALWVAAMTATRMRENVFREKYQRYIASAPEDLDLRRKARTAVAAKMARVIHALIKHSKPYRLLFDTGLPSGSIPHTHAVGAIRTP